jgi:cell division protease FtsH
MNSDLKTKAAWVVILLLVVMEWLLVRTDRDRHTVDLSFSELMTQIDHGKIKSVTIFGNDLKGNYKDTSEELHAVIPTNFRPLVDKLVANKVSVTYQKESNWNRVSVLINAAPFLLLVGFCILVPLLGFRMFLKHRFPTPSAHM